MKTYLITIKLSNGYEIQARSVGNDPLEAQHRVLDAPQTKQFLQGLTFQSIHIELESKFVSEEANPDRYHFQESSDKQGWYVVTDTEAMVVITFEKGKFNETQRITHLSDEVPEALEGAKTLRKFVDYLQQYHPEVL